jgi:hypothetical protein
MTSTAPDLLAQLSAAAQACADVSVSAADFAILDDSALLAVNRLAAQVKRTTDAIVAVTAGEVAHRSTRELGQSGLAQRQGFRSPEEFIKTTTGTTFTDATTAVKIGRMVRETTGPVEIDPATGEQALPHEPWLAPVARAVTEGHLSVGAAAAIRTGLGKPCDGVDATTLAAAAAQLCSEATALDIDRLLRRAREVRNEIDEAGVADREKQLFEKRSFRHFTLANGMGRVTWDLEPESYAHVTELYDRATSPKRGVRFVSGDREELAKKILNDPRSIAQLASDTLLGLLQSGADADSSQLLGTGAAQLRVIVTQEALDTGNGHGIIEGSNDPLSIQTLQRLQCTAGITPVLVDTTGQALDVGREQRFFTQKQRIALTVRDGGCMWDDCERPPSFTEAHHIRFWARDKGKTDIADGILLCKFHHLLLHNNGWQIERVGAQYYLIPPPSIDPDRTPRPMKSKNAAMRGLAEQDPARGMIGAMRQSSRSRFDPGWMRGQSALRGHESTGRTTSVTARVAVGSSFCPGIQMRQESNPGGQVRMQTGQSSRKAAKRRRPHATTPSAAATGASWGRRRRRGRPSRRRRCVP